MTKSYVSKQKVRDFVSRISSDKTDAIENEYEALLTKEIKSLDAFKRLEDALSEARKAAMEIRQAGFGGSVLANMPTSDFLIDRMISRGKSFYHEPPKAGAAICKLLKPFVERLTKVRNARQSAYRIIDEAQTGRAAADALREAGLDYYWQNNTPVHSPDEFWFRYYESDTNVPIDNIGVGDWVVVKSRNGLGVARVLKKAKDLDTVRMQGFKGNVVKQVIAVIDTSKCDKRESDRAKLEDIEKKLEQKAKNAERLTMYRLLAKDNPEFSALLTEYESVKASVDEL